MASPPSLHASRAYAAAQIVLLAAFAAIVLWNPGAPLFASPGAAIAGNAIGIAGVVVIAFLGVKRRVEERFLLAAYPEYARYRKRTVAFP